MFFNVGVSFIITCTIFFFGAFYMKHSVHSKLYMVSRIGSLARVAVVYSSGLLSLAQVAAVYSSGLQSLPRVTNLLVSALGQ